MSARSIVITGDQSGMVYFLDAESGAAALPAAGPFFTNVVAPPLLYGQTAITPMSAPGGTGEVRAFNIADGTELWDLQLSASLAATPALLQTTLYVGTSDGFVRVFDLSAPAAPRNLANVDVMQLGPSRQATLFYTLPSPDGNQLYVITSQGLYTLDVATLKVAGSANTGMSFSTPPLLGPSRLILAGGSTAIAHPYDQSGLSPSWSYTNPTGARIAAIAPTVLSEYILLLDEQGNVIVVDEQNGSSNTTVTPGPQPTAPVTWAFSGDLLAVADAQSRLYVHQLNLPGEDIGWWLLYQWQKPLAAGRPSLLATFRWNTIDPATTLFVLSAGGTGTAYKLQTGDVVWQTPITDGGAWSQPVLTTNTASTASVRFLLDGQNYFLTFRNLVLAVQQASFTKPTALSPPTFHQTVAAAGGAGRSVFLDLWSMGLTAFYFDAWRKSGADENFYENALTSKAYQEVPNVQTVLESYYQNNSAWYAFNPANHQKLSVFSINGHKVALVGGVNTQSQYWDWPEHPLTPPNYTGWHDSALLLQGEAVELVEQEFDRRWIKAKGSAPLPQSNTYAKVAAWCIYDQMCLDDPALCQNGLPPTPYTDPSVPAPPPVPVEVLITNAEYDAHVSRIRQALIKDISGASQWIYFENLAFGDIPLTRTLITRLKTAGPDFRVVINVPLPKPDLGVVDQSYSVITHTMLAAIWLSLDTWISFDSEDGELIERAGVESYQVTLVDEGEPGNLSVMNSYLTYTLKSGGPARKTLLRRIHDVRTNDPRVLLCGPARWFPTYDAGDTKSIVIGWPANYRGFYLHSKLAIFDGKVAFVGSANFTQRSMYMDGEMSVRIDDPATVQRIASQLFAHWNMTTVANWGADMQTFARLGAGSPSRVGILPTTIAALVASTNNKLDPTSWFTLNYLVA